MHAHIAIEIDVTPSPPASDFSSCAVRTHTHTHTHIHTFTHVPTNTSRVHTLSHLCNEETHCGARNRLPSPSFLVVYHLCRRCAQRPRPYPHAFRTGGSFPTLQWRRRPSFGQSDEAEDNHFCSTLTARCSTLLLSFPFLPSHSCLYTQCACFLARGSALIFLPPKAPAFSPPFPRERESFHLLISSFNVSDAPSSLPLSSARLNKAEIVASQQHSILYDSAPCSRTFPYLPIYGNTPTTGRLVRPAN